MAKKKERHSRFVTYMDFIVTHPNYDGMPDAYNVDGTIQWEAPSNRASGIHKDTHHKRRDWWRAKAVAIGIDPESAQWISRVAKAIHPTGEKPCDICGRVLTIAYAYPNKHFMKRLQKLEYINENFSRPQWIGAA